METQMLNDGRKKKWILIANRAEAKVLEADWRIDHLEVVKDIPFPDGRKQNREIDADVYGTRFSSIAGRGNNSSVHGGGTPSRQQKHGLNRHEESTEHKANVFAKKLCNLLHDGRTHNEYDELILVAEPHFLGRIRSFLDKETANHVITSVNENWVPLRTNVLQKKIRKAIRGDLH